LMERMRASCWVVIQSSSWTMASACCSISGLTVVTEWPEGRKSWAPLFLFQKPSLFPPSDQWCFCWPQHFHKHCKEDVCGCFSLTAYWQQEILSQHTVYCTSLTRSIVRHCCNGAICQKSLQSINARNFKFASSKIWNLLTC
jgi:hypothetical protein